MVAKRVPRRVRVPISLRKYMIISMVGLVNVVFFRGHLLKEVGLLFECRSGVFESKDLEVDKRFIYTILKPYIAKYFVMMKRSAHLIWTKKSLVRTSTYPLKPSSCALLCVK